MSQTNDQKANQYLAGNGNYFQREDERFEIAKKAPIGDRISLLVDLGIIPEDRVNVEDLKEYLFEETGGKSLKFGELNPRDQFRWDRAVLHVYRMRAINTVSDKEGVQPLMEEKARLEQEAQLYPEREHIIRNKLQEVNHYISMGKANGKRINGAAIEDGNYIFQKQVEGAAREAVGNLRVRVKEEGTEITLRNVRRQIEEFQDKGKL